MEHYFASLSKRQTMLLLASVVFGGALAEEAFRFLPEEEAELLKHRSEAFRSISKEQRVPFLVREMRHMLNARRRRLATADPRHLAELLAKEKPIVAAVILRALPSALAHSVQSALPGFQEMRLRKEPSEEIFSIVRWKLEEELQNSSFNMLFRFGDLLGLQARELITICDRMGVRVFATALMGLPSNERQSFIDALPPDQKMLAQKACDAAKTRHLQVNDARRLLELYDATANPSLALRSAGARRIIRACLAESLEFASKISKRYEGELGELLSRWFGEEKSKQIRGDGGRKDILEQLEFLAKRGFLERPLMLPKPKIALANRGSIPSKPAPGKVSEAALSAIKPATERFPKPTASKLSSRPGSEKENVATVSRAANRPQTMEGSPPKATGAKPSISPPPKTTMTKRPTLSPALPMPQTTAEDMPTGKAIIGKASVVRVPALQSVPRRRIAEIERQEGDRAESEKGVGTKATRKS